MAVLPQRVSAGRLQAASIVAYGAGTVVRRPSPSTGTWVVSPSAMKAVLTEVENLVATNSRALTGSRRVRIRMGSVVGHRRLVHRQRASATTGVDALLPLPGRRRRSPPRGRIRSGPSRTRPGARCGGPRPCGPFRHSARAGRCPREGGGGRCRSPGPQVRAATGWGAAGQAAGRTAPSVEDRLELRGGEVVAGVVLQIFLDHLVQPLGLNVAG